MSYAMKLESVLSGLAERHGWDYGVKFESAYECAWSAELRITKKPNDHGSMDVSEVYFLTGLASPEEGAKELWENFRSMT